MTISEKLLVEVERFMLRYNMPYTRFGELSCRDRNAVRRLREGHGITTRRYEQIKNFMAEYRLGNAPARRGGARYKPVRAAA